MSFLCLDYDKEKTFCPIVQLSNQGGMYFPRNNLFQKIYPFYFARLKSWFGYGVLLVASDQKLSTIGLGSGKIFVKNKKNRRKIWSVCEKCIYLPNSN